jgi:hypothetical protein
MLRSTLAALVGGTLLCAPGTFADVLTVAVDGSGDYSRIQDAINASTGGDTILVSPGVYQERISIAGKAIEIVCAGEPRSVMVDGQGKGRVVNIQNSAEGRVRLAGLVIAGGSVTDYGAGVRVSGALAEFEDCLITGNTTHGTVGCAWCTGNRVRGGGMAVVGGSEVVLNRTDFESNVVQISLVAWGANGQARGGGLYIENATVLMSESSFLDNDAIPEDYPPNCANCNWPATGVGGAICVSVGGDLVASDCEVLDSEIHGHKASWGLGAGVAVMGGQATFESCLLRGNRSSIPPNCNCGPEKNWGGAFYVGESGNLSVENCEIALNVVSGTGNDLGSVLYLEEGSASLLGNTICANEGAEIVGDWSDLGGNVITSICCEDGDEADADGDGTCDIADECPLDPGKVSPGVCGCGVPDDDSDGDGVLDCEDLCPFDPTRIEPTPCGCGAAASADLNGDLTVDSHDLGILLAFWRDYTAYPLADLNFDGEIAATDLGLLLGHWGPCR